MNPDSGGKVVPIEDISSEAMEREPLPTTRWSLIEESQDTSSSEFRTEMGVLCQKYWPPAYRFIRSYWSCGSEEAKNLCQAFFLKFYEKDFVQGMDVDKGRFRTFMCVALKRFLSKSYREMSSLIRKPSQGPILSMDGLVDEEEVNEIADPYPPSGRLHTDDFKEAFQAEWKKQVVHNVLSLMRGAAKERGEELQVEIFARYRLEYREEAQPTRSDLADEFGLTLDQIRIFIRDEEENFTRFICEEIVDQVSSPADLEDEVRILFGL